MRLRFRFIDWPLRVKLAALLVVASLVPLLVATYIDIRAAREQSLASTAALLAARGDHLVGELDAFNLGYQRSTDRLAHLPDVLAFCQGTGTETRGLEVDARAALGVWPRSASEIRGVAILDPSGVVQIGTERALEGKSLAFHRYVQEALQGRPVISDIHLAEPEVDYAPTVAYLAPVRGPSNAMIALVVVWVRATSLWNLAKASNGLAGPNSFAVMFDAQGIRVAHTYSDDIVFHPGGPLDPDTIDAAVAEGRFGDKTRALLGNVRPFPEQFDRARSPSTDRAVFRGYAPVNGKWNYGVGRRLETVPWTVFYMIPEESLDAPIADMTERKMGFAGAIILLALGAGALFATIILRPIGALSKATESLGKGDLSVHVEPRGDDEIGRLATSFNAMAARLGEQDASLRRARDDLEERVKLRTAELQESEESLRITLDSIGDAMIATDAEGQVVRMNPVAEKLTGWPASEAKGQPLAKIFRIVNEDTRATVESPVDRVLREGLVVGLANHTALIARDGSECAIADSGAPIRDGEGVIKGVVLIFRDQTEEREAGRALRESEARKAAVMEASIDCVVLMDGTGAVIDFNAAAEKTFGYARADVLGKSLSEVLVPKSLREKHSAGLARYLETGEGPILGKRIEVNALRSDGTEFPAEVAVVRINTEGAPLFTGYIRDITERRRAAEAIRVSDARFRRLTECGLIGIVLGDTTGKIHEVNDAFLKIVGYTREDLQAGKIRSSALNPPEWAETQEAARQQLMSVGVTKPWEKEFVRKDGSRVPVLMGVTMLDPPDCLNIILDLTEQKRAEAAIRSLREQREVDAKFRGLLEAAPDAMVIVDREGRIVLINAQAETLFGYPREELLGESVDRLVPDRFREVHPSHRARYFTDSKPRAMGSGLELFGRHKDGREFPVEVSIAPLETKDGVLVSSAIRDITERKRVEEELRHAKNVAETASRELEAFSYSVAHDLRAPLRAINGYSAALLEDFGDTLEGDASEYLGSIRAGAARMAELIDALLGLSRVSRTPLAHEPVDLTALAKASIEQLRASDPGRMVDVAIEEGLRAHGDRRLLRSLLENLLGNAWKFTSKVGSPCIEFGRAERDGVVAYFVHDNGAGFNMAYAEKLFAPFQRLHGQHEFAGTGIGLATVHRIVQRHEGRIWAEGAVDHGADFYFTLNEAQGASLWSKAK